MAFFDFSQNNSGGRYSIDPDRGIGKTTIIEAATADEANRKAESIGLYFDGTSTDRDCDCCGDRFYRAYGDGDATPNVYGQRIVLRSNGKAGFLHAADGRVFAFDT